MASAVVLGVNPVYGLYASMAGPIGGGLAVSTRLMVVTTTTAAALAAGSSLGAFSGADRPEALFGLSGLAGVMMVAAGVLRWVASRGLSRSRSLRRAARLWWKPGT
jgi:SulP family sulfate permease